MGQQSLRQEASRSVSSPSRALRVACGPGNAVRLDAASRQDYSPDISTARHDSLSRSEIERRVKKAANLMIAADKLAPYDKRAFNPALVLWYAVWVAS